MCKFSQDILIYIMTSFQNRSEPMIFLQKAPKAKSSDTELQPWTWPEHVLSEKVSATPSVIDENKASPSTPPHQASVVRADPF